MHFYRQEKRQSASLHPYSFNLRCNPTSGCGCNSLNSLRGHSSYLWHLFNVPEKYLLVPGDRCGSVIIYQLVQRIELHHPEEILASPISKHLEVLYIISKPGRKEWRTRKKHIINRWVFFLWDHQHGVWNIKVLQGTVKTVNNTGNTDSKKMSENHSSIVF